MYVTVSCVSGSAVYRYDNSSSGGCLALPRATLRPLCSSCRDNGVSVLASAISERGVMASQLFFEHLTVVVNLWYMWRLGYSPWSVDRQLCRWYWMKSAVIPFRLQCTRGFLLLVNKRSINISIYLIYLTCVSFPYLSISLLFLYKLLSQWGFFQMGNSDHFPRGKVLVTEITLPRLS